MAFPTRSLKLVAASSQYASRADAGSTGLRGYNTNFTFETWFKLTTDVSSSEMDFASKWSSANNYIFRYYDVSGVKLLLSTTSDTTSGVAVSRLATGEWHHIAFVYTLATTTQEIFLDGISLGSDTSSGTVSNGADDFLLGQQSGGAGYFNGQMCLTRFWTTARTAAQLVANWGTILGSTSGLSAEWTLDNTYNDNSGNSNTLTGQNSPTFVADVPRTQGPTKVLALALASSQQANVNDTASLSITGSMSVFGRVKFATLPANNGDRYTIASKAEATNSSTDWTLELLNSAGTYYINFHVRNTAGANVSETYGGALTGIATGVWYSFGGVFTSGAGTKVHTWWNGVAQTNNTDQNATTTVGDNGTPTRVGCRGTGTYLDGNISDVRIWSRALSDQEMVNLALYPCIVQNGANLAAWWTLDNTDNDSSGNSNTLTRTNSAAFTSDSPYTCAIYTKEGLTPLPGYNADLATAYANQDYIDVETKDNVRVTQTDLGGYAIHQFKNVFSGSSCTLEWEGQSDVAPTTSTVYLQIFNRSTLSWDAIDSDNTSSANTDFILTGSVADLTNYKDAGNVITCRVYQQSI
jgi:hypothetical protein